LQTVSPDLRDKRVNGPTDAHVNGSMEIISTMLQEHNTTTIQGNVSKRSMLRTLFLKG